MAYATEPDLSAWTREDIPTATASLLLDLASGAVDDEVGRPLASTERTDSVDADEASTVLVHWPVTAVASVTLDGDAVDAADYTWSRAGLLRRTSGTWDGVVEVTYTCGFASGAAELATAKRITLELAARVAGNPQALESLNADGVAATFGPGMALDEQQRRDLARLRSRMRQ